MTKPVAVELRCHGTALILIISHFGFEGRIFVLIAPVPGLCIRVTFTMQVVLKNSYFLDF